MARVILNGERIVKLSVRPGVGTEVGPLPKGVGLERLRWDGVEIVDLYDLDEFYVDKTTLKLYVNPREKSSLVQMQYKDRKHLMFDKTLNEVRLKTQEEINKPKVEEYKARRRAEYPNIGDQLDAIIKYLKTTQDLPSELEQIINTIDNVKDRWPKPKNNVEII
jgi:hypothetical protein